MKYKHIAFIGVTLISMVILLSALLYYLNEDTGTCYNGTFPCDNSTRCLPQRNICDRIPQCDHGDDEIDCNDYYGDLDFLNWGMLNFTKPIRCDFPLPPDKCKYDNCLASCWEYNQIPQDLDSNVRQISLRNSSITELKASQLNRYAELTTLELTLTRILTLDQGVFAKQNKLKLLILTNNEISEIHPGHLSGLSNLDTFYADRNQMTFADLSDLNGSSVMRFINLTENLLTASNFRLPYLPALELLYLNENKFRTISEELFVGCAGLKSLHIAKNVIETIDQSTFENLKELTELNLANNKIGNIKANTFRNLTHLTKLELGFNPLTKLSPTFFQSLPNLHSLGFQALSVTDHLEKNAFDAFPQLEYIYFESFYYCAAYAPNVKKCVPAGDGVSSFSHLLDKPLLRTAVWSIAIVTCLGNVLVLWGRFTARDENRILSIVVRNLAVSDMLMGVYLFGIAIQDMRYWDNYKSEASSWMTSFYCTTLGVLGMISMEVSMFILSFMSVERFVVIVPPLSHRETPRPIALMFMCIFWLLGIVIAIAPAVYWRKSTKFYGVNGMCFPLHIDDPYFIGWEYSAFVFIGLNLFGLIIIGSAYAGMFASIWRTQRAAPLPVSDSEFALRLFFIVLTNALCWAPIITLKLLAMRNYPVPPELHAWIVTFILPINSAVNPLLYTFTTTRFQERIKGGWVGTVRNYLAGGLSRQESEIFTLRQGTVKLDSNFQSLDDSHAKHW